MENSFSVDQREVGMVQAVMLVAGSSRWLPAVWPGA